MLARMVNISMVWLWRSGCVRPIIIADSEGGAIEVPSPVFTGITWHLPFIYWLMNANCVDVIYFFFFYFLSNWTASDFTFASAGRRNNTFSISNETVIELD